MEFSGYDVGSISNRYEVQLLEIGRSEPTAQKLLTVFTVFEDVIPQLGVFKKVMTLVRKELLNAVYSDAITSSVEKAKETGGRKRTKEKEERREFLERIPYFTLVHRMREGQNESITTLNEELHSLKEALFTKSQECDANVAKIAELNDFIENLNQRQSAHLRDIADKDSLCKKLDKEIDNLTMEMNRARSSMENNLVDAQLLLEEEKSKVRELSQFKDGFLAMDAAFSPHRNPLPDGAAKTGANTSGANTSGANTSGANTPGANVTSGAAGSNDAVASSPRGGQTTLKTASTAVLPSLPESKAVPVSKKSFLLSNLENCIKLENQIVGVQNTVVAEFDAFLERLKDEVLTAVKTSDETAMGGIQSISMSLSSMADEPSERQKNKREEQRRFSDSQKELFLQQKQFQDHMDRILKELELLRQQKEAVQDQLQAMEKARQRKKGSTPGMDGGGGGGGGGAGEGDDQVGNSDDEDDEDFMSMDPFVPQEQLLSRYAVMVYTSKNNAKTWEETKFGKYCPSCGAKTIICPHKVVLKDKIFPLAKNCTHIRFSRPKILLNTELVRKVMDDSGISPAHGKVALSLATTTKSWRKTKTAFWIKPMMNVGTDSHLTMPLNKVFDDFRRRTGNAERKIPRRLSVDHVISTLEQFWAFIIWQDEFSLEDENLNSCLDNLYSFMHDRYLLVDVKNSAAYDLLNCIVDQAMQHRTLQFIANIFCGNLDGSAFRYALLLGEFINHVNWTETEDFRRFCRIVYPFLGEDDLENLHMGFMSFCENKVSKIIVWEYMVYVIIKYREPRFQDMESKLLQHGGQRKESMTDTEFAEAIDQLIPLANEKLRKRLFMEASLSLRQLNVESNANANDDAQPMAAPSSRTPAKRTSSFRLRSPAQVSSAKPQRQSAISLGSDGPDAVPVMRLAQISSFLSLANVTTAIRDTIDANIRETRLSGERATTTTTTTAGRSVKSFATASPTQTPFSSNDEPTVDEDLVFTYSSLRQIAANTSRLKNDDKIRNIVKSESRAIL